MRSFSDLSRRGRLSRLRQVAETALDVYGLKDARLGFIQYYENIIYLVDVKGSAAGRAEAPYVPNRYLLRIHAMRESAAIASELTWLKALSEAGGFAVPAPVPTTDGRLLSTITTPGFPEGKVVSLMRWLDGRRIRRAARPQHLVALGKVVAQLHDFSAGWEPPYGFSRPVWDWESQLGGSMFRFTMQELVESMPSKYREPFQVVSLEAKQAMTFIAKGAAAYGMIHGDLFLENVLFKAGRALPIDFEDCGFGYWMSDIAVALSQWAWGDDWERMRDAFWEGYDPIRSLPEAQSSRLVMFMAAHFASMLLWATAFLKNDPKRVQEYEPWRDKNGEKLLEYFRL